jgi:hypothetical protein
MYYPGIRLDVFSNKTKTLGQESKVKRSTFEPVTYEI